MDMWAIEIQQYCMDHRMRLNPKKCKEMFVNFMFNPNKASRDLIINGAQVESVHVHKLLGVMLESNLKWNRQVNEGTKKASKDYTLLEY